MLQVEPTVDWGRAQAALRHEVARVTALLRAVGDPGAHAVGQWTLAEVAMHLSQAFVAVPGLARQDLSEVHAVLPGLPGRSSGSLIADIWDLGDTTTMGVSADQERDPVVIADRIDERAARFLDDAAGRSPDEIRPWLVEGVTVGLPTLTCHLLNETVMHGRDIAVADKRSWSIEAASAALVLDGFIVPILGGLGSALVDQRAAAGLHACYDLRVRGGGRHQLAFDHGVLTVDQPGSRRVDCHLSVDPGAFLLVAWGRMNQWSAIARGQLLAWGRRPWLGPRLRSLLRNP